MDATRTLTAAGGSTSFGGIEGPCHAWQGDGRPNPQGTAAQERQEEEEKERKRGRGHDDALAGRARRGVLGVAVPAVDRAARRGLEGHLGLVPAVGADCIVHLAGRAAAEAAASAAAATRPVVVSHWVHSIGGSEETAGRPLGDSYKRLPKVVRPPERTSGPTGVVLQRWPPQATGSPVTDPGTVIYPPLVPESVQSLGAIPGPVGVDQASTAQTQAPLAYATLSQVAGRGRRGTSHGESPWPPTSPT
jgi:hypothetical protein